jgi:hypothetical protein
LEINHALLPIKKNKRKSLDKKAKKSEWKLREEKSSD